MPFTLAHPAAILPLRRFCPRYLSFAALLIGSIVPDLAYVLDDLNRFPHTMVALFGPAAREFACVREDWEWSTLAHTLAGSVCFCLPLGMLLLGLFFTLRSALVTLLPNPHRDVLLPLCQKPRGSALAWMASLLTGVWLHLGWDSFTHDHGWFVENCSFLRAPLLEWGAQPIDGASVIWFLCSAGGIAALTVAYGRFLRRQQVSPWSFPRTEARYYARWSAVVLTPLLIAVPTTVHYVRLESTWNDHSYVFHIFAEYYLITLGIMVVLMAAFTTWKLKRLNAAR